MDIARDSVAYYCCVYWVLNKILEWFWNWFTHDIIMILLLFIDFLVYF